MINGPITVESILRTMREFKDRCPPDSTTGSAIFCKSETLEKIKTYLPSVDKVGGVDRLTAVPIYVVSCEGEALIKATQMGVKPIWVE